MRILHVLDHSLPIQSGYSFRTMSILRAQRARGWETAQLTSTKHTTAMAEVEQAGGFTFHRTVATRGLADQLPLLEPLAVVRRLCRRLLQVVAEFKPDIIHAHSPSLNGLAVLRARRGISVPLVYEVRALWEDGAVDQRRIRDGGLLYRAYRSLETHVVRRADAVTTICEGLRQELISRGISASALTVIPNGVDTAFFKMPTTRDHALTKRLGLEGTRIVAFIGSFYAWEGLAFLVHTLPRILARIPNVRLLLVGEGPEVELLKRQVRSAGLVDKVVFGGRVAHQEIRAYYGLADVLVYPRVRVRVTELVTPLKPLEAMAQGRPVVASDVGGHRELIRHGETGLLFRADDSDSLVATLASIFDDPEGAASMAEKARHYIEAERTWAATVSGYATVYRRLINGKG